MVFYPCPMPLQMEDSKQLNTPALDESSSQTENPDKVSWNFY